jgi:Ni,Fe-hydrogenase maturation factor
MSKAEIRVQRILQNKAKLEAKLKTSPKGPKADNQKQRIAELDRALKIVVLDAAKAKLERGEDVKIEVPTAILKTEGK